MDQVLILDAQNRIVNVAEDVPADPGEGLRAVRGAGAIGMVFDPATGDVALAPVDLDARRAALRAAVTIERDRRLARGAPTSAGLHVAMDDGARADLSGMATTALAALSGAIPWPASYAQGWIALENDRIPLPAPGDGIALAALVGQVYAALVQHARDLKDAVAAAPDAAALDAIDLGAGWPA